MKVLYEQKQFPVLQNRVYDTVETARNCPKGDIKIVEDSKTGLIYNYAFDSELIVYDKHYNNEQSLSPSFRRHLDQVSDLIEKVLGKDALVEVGCGKGFFLEMLLKREIDINGFDSTYEGENPRVIKKNFQPGIILKPAKGLILRHVLEHIENPFDFLCRLRDANGGGLIYIEVPCFDWIIRKHAWFDVFYEHVNYFRLSDFERMFNKIVCKGHLFGEQYLYVVADLGTLKDPLFNEAEAVSFPLDFLNGLISKDIKMIEKKPICIWGGGSKGVIFSLLCIRSGLDVDVVIDVNPRKQGKFLPVTGLQVKSPEEALEKMHNGTIVHIMNSNYMEEIKKMSNNLFNYVGVEQ